MLHADPSVYLRASGGIHSAHGAWAGDRQNPVRAAAESAGLDQQFSDLDRSNEGQSDRALLLRGRVPSMSRKMASDLGGQPSQPVMLIAVNSGSSPDQVARYVKQQRINIPVIMDVDRSLERAAGVNEVSLQNIWQARVIGPDGELTRADGGDIPGTLQSAAADASWNVDPSLMSVAMMPTWRQVEFGDYSSASKMVNRFVNDRRPDFKAAGEALQNHVNEQLNAMVEQAVAANDSGETWNAFRLYEAVESKFAGYELPEVVGQQLSALKKDNSMGQQIEAMKLWKIIEKTSQSSRVSPTRVGAMLETIIIRYPGTEAASMTEAAIGR